MDLVAEYKVCYNMLLDIKYTQKDNTVRYNKEFNNILLGTKKTRYNILLDITSQAIILLLDIANHVIAYR